MVIEKLYDRVVHVQIDERDPSTQLIIPESPELKFFDLTSFDHHTQLKCFIIYCSLCCFDSREVNHSFLRGQFLVLEVPELKVLYCDKDTLPFCEITCI